MWKTLHSNRAPLSVKFAPNFWAFYDYPVSYMWFESCGKKLMDNLRSAHAYGLVHRNKSCDKSIKEFAQDWGLVAGTLTVICANRHFEGQVPETRLALEYWWEVLVPTAGLFGQKWLVHTKQLVPGTFRRYLSPSCVPTFAVWHVALYWVQINLSLI